MTLAELKDKCKTKGWKINKISEKPARMYKVSYKAKTGSYVYTTYVRRKCSACKKEVMKDIDTYRRKNIKPMPGKCMFGKPQRSFCSYKCRAEAVSGEKHYMYERNKVYFRKNGGYAMMKRYNHPHRNNHNFVQRSRLVIEDKIGRYLKPYKDGQGELVHHINMCKTDDNYENLMLCNGASEHLLVHATFNKICKPLIDAGIIGFDTDEGYYLTELGLVLIKMQTEEITKVKN